MVAFLDGFHDVFTGRIHHGYHTEKGKACFDGVDLVILQICGEDALGCSQDAQSFSGIVIVACHYGVNPLLCERDNLVAYPQRGTHI